jgi:hypothetical protein
MVTVSRGAIALYQPNFGRGGMPMFERERKAALTQTNRMKKSRCDRAREEFGVPPGDLTSGTE